MSEFLALANEIATLALTAILARLILFPFLPPSFKNPLLAFGFELRQAISEGSKRITAINDNASDNFTEKMLNDIFVPFSLMFIGSALGFSIASQTLKQAPSVSIALAILSIAMFAAILPRSEEVKTLFEDTEPLGQLEFFVKIIIAVGISAGFGLAPWLTLPVVFFPSFSRNDAFLLDL